MPPLHSVEQLRIWWQQRTHAGVIRLCLALAATAWVGAALLARQGLAWSRAAALFVMLVGALPGVLLVLRMRRQRRDDKAVLHSTVMQTEPELALALLRAAALSQASEADDARGSVTLARLHLQRSFGRIDRAALTVRAERVAWLATGVALLAAVGALVAAASDPLRLVEGANVLLAQDGLAPMTIRWIEREQMVVEPPSYLGLPQARLSFGPTRALPIGSEITVRGRALHPGRDLRLTDGRRSVPFVSDGGQALVARWKVTEDATVRLAAQFGDSRIESPVALRIHALPDYVPHVRLEGAPRRQRLLAAKRIAIHWEATDDHGIDEVSVVLRAGEREQRREVSKPRGGSVSDRGGIDLLSDDPFLARSYLPIEVTVQATDNDTEGGPNIGISAAITLLPPAIGEREVIRFRALRRGRDALALLLAQRLEAPVPTTVSARRYLAQQRAADQQAQRALADASAGRLEELASSVTPLALSGPLAALLLGQAEQLRKALVEASKHPGAASHRRLVERTEQALLAVDSALDALGAQDTRRAAKKLSEVATDALNAMALAGEPVHRQRAQTRLYADVQALREGGGHMQQLGWLGRDLGEIVLNHLARVERAWSAGDPYHARLAMHDLLARLRAPDPSMRSSGGGSGGPGGGGHQHGVEAGGGPGQAEGQPASQAAKQGKEQADAIEQLRQHNAAERDAAQQALDDALTAAERERLQQQLKDVAEQIRQVAKSLPQQASAPESAQADAARARAQAEAAASALERGDSEGAMRRGREAMQSLQAAQSKGAQRPQNSADAQAGRAAQQAAERLGKLLRQAKQAADGAQRRASERAGSTLRSIGGRVGELAKQAQRLRDQSRSGEAPLPQAIADKLGRAAHKMAAASRALKAGEGQRALRLQREAQRLLEMAQPDPPNHDPASAADGDGGAMARDAEVPAEQRSREAAEFRKRVTEGLSKPVPPHLREALRRYTEGLLR